ncbi:NAD(P)/FAD-dependent oxidoreductase [Anaerotalea alkaliphila]|uniref:NAD(P)/FAD-dependent oxidoreductase n=1 Tax=Anaerotalea alkaliphila TaxID=2662126 RepID=A0A7X5HUF5_9FIRM|nr:NAD(P)/FAD-dependent oxidoreductase [Anaerotalea alkaliphila]NDL66745.1 NAD(P)/FAD-dependent oxidoreductase [Anaerotalea alkaliphila]
MFDLVIVGAGAAGVFAAYEIVRERKDLKVLMLEKGLPLDRRRCPKKGSDRMECGCKSCSIMEGFYGAGGFSDGKYNITNNFGGELHKHIGAEEAMELMWQVDAINLAMGGQDAKLYTTADNELKREALRHDLHLLDAQVRHLGTDRNLVIAQNMYDFLKDRMQIRFSTEVVGIRKEGETFSVETEKGTFQCKKLILATGRTGSKWIEQVCRSFGIRTTSNRVDIGVRVELPALLFKHITDQVYESKIVYRTKKYNDLVRTFCMNPYGEVVSENYGDIVTVNGHSYADPELHTENTNFALLVSHQFTEPFKDSNEYGASIARLSNMLGGGVLMQRFGDLVKGRRSNERRMAKCFTRPTMAATPGDLSLVLPKRQLDDIVEMIHALDKIAPGTANEDTLLYGVEVKFYNSNVAVDGRLETSVPGMFILGDCSGVTHSLSQAAASGIHVARILKGDLAAE